MKPTYLAAADVADTNIVQDDPTRGPNGWLLDVLLPSSLTIDLLLTALDARCPRTYEHSLRVATFSDHLADELQLRAPLRERLVMAARLHDIGKIAISDQVLNKAGRLTREEKLEIQRHPDLGFNLLARIPTWRTIAVIVRHHHERLDGQGYPDGLSGDAIPLEARIIAVADTLDAMTAHRPYRDALPFTNALEEINHHVGDQFDPVVVAALNRLAQSWVNQSWSLAAPEDVIHHAYLGHEELMHSRMVRPE